MHTAPTENGLLNAREVQVFIIIAASLDKWAMTHSEEGKAVLKAHYQWAAELKAKNKLMMAGPVDLDLSTVINIAPAGHITGFIMLHVASREEAISWAEKDPFVLHGYRRNSVHALNIKITDKTIYEYLQKTINHHE